MRAVDIVQPDVMYIGGIARTLEVAAHGGRGRTALHAAQRQPARWSRSARCTSSVPSRNAGKYLELSIEGADYYPWQDGLFLQDPYAVRDGQVTIPAEPGWGVEINPRWLEAAAYQRSSLST